jgi:hypothetical protein
MTDRAQHKANGSRRPAQIMADIYRTRDEMDHTLHQLEQRLQPRHLMEQGVDYVKNSGGREYVSNLAGSVKSHPLPATLTGIGLAWLMAVGEKRGASDGGGMRSAGGTSTGPGIGERMQSAKESVSQRASQLTGNAREQMERARRGWDSVVTDHPLALGAIGLAIGAVIAAMAPRTRTEDELLGEASNQFKDQVKQKTENVEPPPPDPMQWPASARPGP